MSTKPTREQAELQAAEIRRNAAILATATLAELEARYSLPQLQHLADAVEDAAHDIIDRRADAADKAFRDQHFAIIHVTEPPKPTTERAGWYLHSNHVSKA